MIIMSMNVCVLLLLLCITGAALRRVPLVHVNPWISESLLRNRPTEEPMKFHIRSQPSRIVNPWIEIPNVDPRYGVFKALLRKNVLKL